MATEKMPIQPIWPFFVVNGLDWQCCLDGSIKTAPRILIVSIVMGADYSFVVKNNEIWAPAFFKHNNSFIATVYSHYSGTVLWLPPSSAGSGDVFGWRMLNTPSRRRKFVRLPCALHSCLLSLVGTKHCMVR